ncbi:putative 5-nitroimidazole antibiotic resistance [Salmonella enterica subsp. enterica]|uniref:Putative 5-nitroimidazole antibiotic resistance n=1 Tax=Salmonella enterica I TaxID=59201 RepID=A0A447MVW1_SALET|nr:putative 5-nitroimidazole antibiotic resistance [Salmonella enterica subsp. enterica]
MLSPVNYWLRVSERTLDIYFHGARTGKKMRLLRKNPAVCIEMDGDHALLRADDPCDYSYAYTSVFATGLASILQTREEIAPRPGRHYAPDRSGKNLQLSGRYDESGFAWCVSNATPSPAADIWRLRANKSDSTSALSGLEAVYRPDKRSAVNIKKEPYGSFFFHIAHQAFFNTSLTISTASFSICLRCSSPRKLSQ